MHIRTEDPAQPEIAALLERGEAESARLYPAESNHHLPLDALRAAHVRFHVARDAHGHAIGTGALVLHGAWAEVKRIWVEPHTRGRSLSKAILHALEADARRHGVRVLRLETGIHSHAALRLYRTAGFVERPPFADYRPDRLSVFMEKHL
ncbi:GNAT family N-acetyltransferase [Burkholderia sp. FERM BP-3421]|jgi:putative acetyltransferase|uniref:GNAT family N-acetyltransferase n=1 Tax=Burkholderia sp. FERM BP-3421 TaxID=1494466 RepID=UPI0023610A36|nr:GNAT family N-acetyltransferase [Burkholderia sp. FERM BP-3421]WDD92488.1 GNAT family N-acetyltransferase [Burkholderia sp. FERM BP-3421]